MIELTSLLTPLAVLIVLLLAAAWSTWLERRLLGIWQDRLGPNRVGPFGLFQVIADMIKIFTKEDWIPPFADKALFVIAPMILMIMTLLGFAIIPFSPDIQIAEFDNALLFILAISSLSVYSIMLAGFSSNSKYSLLGALRTTAQMLSYEVFMGLSLMGVVVIAGSFSLNEIVQAQSQYWFILSQPLGFLLFLFAGVAESHRAPFDLPEAETEIVAGFHTEYASMKFGMFFIGEYLGVIFISALITTLYFGGWQGPLLPPIVWFTLKTIFFVMFFILLRAAIPRPRYDQLMSFGWSILLPLALLNLLLTAVWKLTIGF
ncbi:NADH-quinone oxidoreductase subunit NuoH [Shewanella sp. D64]|uniref:NADH-quinone oxidoreductase subunit NuoH n=1 Tax=unclassified Shewanella TaxID=196818 RepID=UPI0022BA2F85|nr:MULTISPECIES: NADH-quinone oxidoreductase subunit NuoH [unclassified Shewanella]MEC4724773.1 NADH-quinone oxidoreductase subunit NuoH [Shewanella sp. D64]MEC4736433.1 NADH-quinone oxidoreductase subunit NuoH [Shewanella sp. E94]WBJ97509.1 NADH-quinone oxidoreductase subunit NuoH [Shewanella sp. MTB7]